MAPTPRPLADRFWEKTSRGPSCWEWTGHRNNTGYGTLMVRTDRWRPKGAHRIAWELTYGPIPAGLWVLHQCDNPPCVRPDHLYVGTPRDNMADRRDRGRAPMGNNHPARLHPEQLARAERHGAHLHPERVVRGEHHGMARLTAVQVSAIRASQLPGVILAVRYRVSPTTISRIRVGRTWRQADS